MERLRREYAWGEWPSGTTEDEFDSCSRHLVLSIDSEPAGMVRFTKYPPSVLAAWLVEPLDLPQEDHTYQATRSVVSAKWRGFGFYRLLMMELSGYLAVRGAQQVLASVQIDFPLRGFLGQIGYIDFGTPIDQRVIPIGVRLVQVIRQRPMECVEIATGLKGHLLDRLSYMGFKYRSAIASF
jgi:hypothetical protein